MERLLQKVPEGSMKQLLDWVACGGALVATIPKDFVMFRFGVEQLFLRGI